MAALHMRGVGRPKNNRIANNLLRLAAKKAMQLDKTREFAVPMSYNIIV